MAAEIQSRFEKIRILGKGSFGLVSQYRNKVTGKMVAIKQITAVGNYVAFARECNIHGRVNHPCILNCHEILKGRGSIFFVLELADRGSLAKLMFSDNGNRRIPEHEAKIIIVQILCALCYLHARKILHRDIKPENVLLFANGRAKLCDFGFARDIGSVGSNSYLRMSIKGSPLYMSPEMAVGRLGATNWTKYDWRSDVWSLGMMLHEMIFGVVPHNISCSKSISEAMRRITKAPILDLGEGDLAALLRDILQPNFNERLTWREIIIQPWTQSVTSSVRENGELVLMFKRILENAQKDSLWVARVWPSKPPKNRKLLIKNRGLSLPYSRKYSPSKSYKGSIILENEVLDVFNDTVKDNAGVCRKQSQSTIKMGKSLDGILDQHDTWKSNPNNRAQNVSQKQSQSAVQTKASVSNPVIPNRNSWRLDNQARRSTAILSKQSKLHSETKPEVSRREQCFSTASAPVLERDYTVQTIPTHHTQLMEANNTKNKDLLPAEARWRANAKTEVACWMQSKKIQDNQQYTKHMQHPSCPSKRIAQSVVLQNWKHPSNLPAPEGLTAQSKNSCRQTLVKSKSLQESTTVTPLRNIVQEQTSDFVTVKPKKPSLRALLKLAGQNRIKSSVHRSNNPSQITSRPSSKIVNTNQWKQISAPKSSNLPPEGLNPLTQIFQNVITTENFLNDSSYSPRKVSTGPRKVFNNSVVSPVLQVSGKNEYNKKPSEDFQRHWRSTRQLKPEASMVGETKTSVGLNSLRSYSKISQVFEANVVKQKAVETACQTPPKQPLEELDTLREPSPPSSSRKSRRRLRIPQNLGEWIAAIFDVMHEAVSETQMENLYGCFEQSLVKKNPELYDDLQMKNKPGGGYAALNEERDILLWMGVPLVLFENRGSPDLVIHWNCKVSVTITEGAVLLAVALVHGVGCEGRLHLLRKFNTQLASFAKMTINLLERHFDDSELKNQPGPREQIWGAYLLGKLIVIFNLTSLKDPFWIKLAKGLVTVISGKGKRDFFGAYVPVRYRDRMLYGCVFIVNEIMRSPYRSVSSVIAEELKREDTGRILQCMDTSQILNNALEVRTTSQIFRLVVYLFEKKQDLDKATVEEDFVEAKGFFHAKRMFRKLRNTNDPICLEALTWLTHCMAIIAIRNTMFYSVFEAHRILEDWVFPLLKRCVDDQIVADHVICYYGCQMLGSMMRTDYFLQKVLRSDTIDQLIAILTTNKNVRNVRASCIALGNIALLAKEQLFVRIIPFILQKLRSGCSPKLHKDATILLANILRIHFGHRDQVISNNMELLSSLLKNEALPILQRNLSRYWNKRYTARDRQTFQRVLEHTMDSLNRSILLGLNYETITNKYMLHKQAKACRPILQKIVKVEKQESRMGATASFLLGKILDINS